MISERIENIVVTGGSSGTRPFPTTMRVDGTSIRWSSTDEAGQPFHAGVVPTTDFAKARTLIYDELKRLLG